jgi:hypothetical protein
MNDDDRIDFGPLDPSRDGPRWQAQIAQVVARALARRRARSVPTQLAAWSRPALAAATLLAIVVWVLALLPRAPEPSDPTALLSQWAVTGEVPATGKILELFGEDHASR